jgi:GNAT superfamily N-acetyltransferase
MRILWMRMGSPDAAGAPERAESPEPAGDTTGPRVSEVPYDEVEPLRVAWQREDFPGNDPTEYLAQARAVRTAIGQRTFAVHDGRRPIAFAALTVIDDAAEVSALYVLPEFRGDGLGTTLTRVAIDRAGSVRDLWICADDEDRPKRLYARLGFEPVVTTTWCRQLLAPVSERPPGA